MPRGTVSWFDPRTQEGVVLHLGREYPVRAEDMELECRAPRARVHFDVQRSDGVERAVHVRVLAGTRSGPGRARSGLDSGAHHPDDRGGAALTRSHPELRARHSESGGEVAGRWRDALREGDVGAALAFYAPDATLHGDRELSGRRSIESWLAACPLLGRPLVDVKLTGEPGHVTRVEWRAEESAHTAVAEGRLRLRVEHARIREQWG